MSLYNKVYNYIFLIQFVDFVVRACEERGISNYYFYKLPSPPRACTTKSTSPFDLHVPHESFTHYNTRMETQVRIGRPPLFESPEDFDRLVDSYLNLCESSKRPVTLTGLVLALGMCSKNTFYEYAKKPLFKESVARARTLIENAYEEKLHLGPKVVSSSSITFALKNMDWSDKMDVNHGGQAGNPVAVTGIAGLYAALGKSTESEPEPDHSEGT